jgi:hypothetical protein
MTAMLNFHDPQVVVVSSNPRHEPPLSRDDKLIKTVVTYSRQGKDDIQPVR